MAFSADIPAHLQVLEVLIQAATVGADLQGTFTISANSAEIFPITCPDGCQRFRARVDEALPIL